MERIDESRAARLAGDHDQYRALSCRTRILLRKDEERYVRGLAEDVECHLNANDLRPAYRVLKKLYFNSTSQVSTIRREDGCCVFLHSSIDEEVIRVGEGCRLEGLEGKFWRQTITYIVLIQLQKDINVLAL